jgi:hypothetical protein
VPDSTGFTAAPVQRPMLLGSLRALPVGMTPATYSVRLRGGASRVAEPLAAAYELMAAQAAPAVAGRVQCQEGGAIERK